MASFGRRGLVWAVLLLGLASICRSARAQDGAVIWIQPAAGAYAVNETFTVKVGIEDVADLYGAEVRIAFDPARLQVVETSVTPETDLLSPPWQVYFNQVNNEAGTIFYVATLLNPHLPVSGSGALFSFHFRTLAMGAVTVAVTQHTLSNIDGEVIPATTAGAMYQVGQAANRLFLPLILRTMGLAAQQAANAWVIPSNRLEAQDE